MNSKVLAHVTRAAAAALLLLPFLVPVGMTATSGCGDADSCASTRASTYNALEIWQACTPGDVNACIIEPGNPKDCTGVLTCEFAVNPRYRAAAEEAMLSIGEQSRGCYQCSIPNCLSGSTAYCEPVSKRCLVLGDVVTIDGGAGGGGLTGIVTDDAGQ
jgi:hypothetical protein